MNANQSATSEANYTDEELEFIATMARYMKANRVRFPTLTQILAVLHAMGYRRVESATELPKRKDASPSATGKAPGGFRRNPTPRSKAT